MMNPDGGFLNDSTFTQCLWTFKSKSTNYLQDLRTREIGMLPKNSFQRVFLKNSEWLSYPEGLFSWKVTSHDCTVWVQLQPPLYLDTCMKAFIDLKTFVVSISKYGIVRNMILMGFGSRDSREPTFFTTIEFMGFLFLMVQLFQWSNGYKIFDNDELNEYLEIGKKLRKALEQPARMSSSRYRQHARLIVEDELRDTLQGMNINLIVSFGEKKTLISSSQFLRDLSEHVHETTGFSGAQLLCTVNNALAASDNDGHTIDLLTVEDVITKGIWGCKGTTVLREAIVAWLGDIGLY